MSRRAVPLVLALVASLFVAATPVAASEASSGRILYVSTDGRLPAVHCDAGGAKDPWPSVSYALRCLVPGDTLLVRGGVYDERVSYNVGDGRREIKAGRADAPILVTNAPGERPVIRGLLRLSDASYWMFSGINVTSDAGTYGNGDMLVKFRGGTGWVFANGEVWNAKTYGAVRVEPSSTSQPQDWRIVGNCVHRTAVVHDPYRDHNFYIAAGVRGLIEHNVVFAAPNGQNIKVGDDGSRVRSLVIRNNTLYGAAQNVLIFGASANVRIERNIMGGVHGEPWYPNVRGFRLTGRGNTVVDNIAFGTQSPVLTGSDGGGSTETISARGNHHPYSTGFDRQDCSGFYPTRSGATGYGARASGRGEQAGRRILSGDWDGDGIETPGWYDPATSTWLLSNSHRHGTADVVFRYGAPGDEPVVGDWDGDGRTTIGIVRGRNHWYLTNTLGTGAADYAFYYGRPGDVPVIGDWDGDGRDTPGLVRGNWWYMSNSMKGGRADYDFSYGRLADHPITGDWDGDGRDTPGLVRGNIWYMSNGMKGGHADYDFAYGRDTDAVAAADWNGDGRSTPAIIRGFEWFLSNHKNGGIADFAYTLPS